MEGLVLTVNKGIRTIRFNNPKKRNPITTKIFSKIAETLNKDSQNDEIILTILTGTGEYFTGGIDLTEFSKSPNDTDFNHVLDESLKAIRSMLQAVLNYPKLLVVIVNGPAIGIGVTLCGICDVVYATEKASFQAPFVKLGVCVEASASFILPIIMGKSKANELLLLGKTFTAQEAYQSHLVSKVIKSNELEAFMETLSQYGQLNLQSVILNKKLIVDGFRKEILDAFSRETEQISICQRSNLFKENVVAFMARSKKSKL